AVDKHGLQMAHPALKESQIDFRSRRLQPRIVGKESPIVLLGSNNLHRHSAPRSRAQPLIEWKSDVGTLDKNRLLRAVDQIQYALKRRAVSSAISREKLDPIEPLMRYAIASIPRREEIGAQKRSDCVVFDAQHHVVPGGIVLAE